jgi:hypothetical protein
MHETDDASNPKCFVPGTHGCHEALHMAHVFGEMVDGQLAQHPAVLMNPEWKMLADRAAEALADLYQAIGAVHPDPDPSKAMQR